VNRNVVPVLHRTGQSILCRLSRKADSRHRTRGTTPAPGAKITAMSNRFPTIVILITAATYAGFAIWLGADPDALLKAFGIESSTPQMRTEIRAFYGGLEMALAIVMLILWRRDELIPALLLGGIPLAGSAAGRCWGMFSDGYWQAHAVFALVEAVGFAFCLAACWFVGKQDSQPASATH
jgi:hypothetical protein